MNERPAPQEYDPNFEAYVSRVKGTDILSVLEAQRTAFAAAMLAVPEHRAGDRYAEGKWSIREVFGHVLDGERVFAYRALCIARGETHSLPGFDEQSYMKAAPFDGYVMANLVAEFSALRSANLSMLAHLNDAAWSRIGTANGKPISVRALAFVMAGHAEHHLAVLRERYGI